MNVRIGLGTDVHRLQPDYDLWIGGIRIDAPFGAVGHSDADVLIHAVCDALLGALGKRDIGYHFPDSDEKFKNIDSKLLLREVVKLMEEEHFCINNLDCTVNLEKPKLSPFIPQMISCMAEILHCSKSQLSVKAKTGEKIGFIGTSEGISADCIVLINKKDDH